MAKIKKGAVFTRDEDDSDKEISHHEDSDETELSLKLCLENLSLQPKRKLLILSLNGLLLHRVNKANKIGVLKNRVPDAIYGVYRVYKRPFCEEFMSFCLKRFEVGIWSSAIEKNVDAILDTIMKGLRVNLLFVWDQKDCTNTGFKSLESIHKPLFLKDLTKVFHKFDSFSPSNTLFIDDKPYKALLNPENTGVFPTSYDPEDKEDNFLDPKRDLCSYLNEVADSSDFQTYVQEHRFGQPRIGSSHPDWPFYSDVIKYLSKKS